MGLILGPGISINKCEILFKFSVPRGDMYLIFKFGNWYYKVKIESTGE